MNWSKTIRTTHRWVSIIFIATVAGAAFAAASGRPEESMLYYLPLPPLFLQMLTGAYLFVLPYVSRWRRGMTPDGRA